MSLLANFINYRPRIPTFQTIKFNFETGLIVLFIGTLLSWIALGPIYHSNLTPNYQGPPQGWLMPDQINKIILLYFAIGFIFPYISTIILFVYHIFRYLKIRSKFFSDDYFFVFIILFLPYISQVIILLLYLDKWGYINLELLGAIVRSMD